MSKGRFGIHGGQYIPETLMNAVNELEEAYNHYKDDPEFQAELTELLNEYAGRPSRLYYARRMTEDLGGAKIYLKREDLNHTGAHKINNVLGQALLAKKMGKTRLIAETGAGQHGVATATAAALFGMECVVFMGEEDTCRRNFTPCTPLRQLRSWVSLGMRPTAHPFLSKFPVRGSRKRARSQFSPKQPRKTLSPVHWTAE